MATSKIPVWAKGYLTVKNAVWLGIIVFGLILLLGGWSIREVKRMNRNYDDLQKQLENISNQQKEQIKKDSIRNDSLYKDLEQKTAERKNKVTVIYQNRDKNVEKINDPDFNNNDIRNGFRSN